MGKMINSIIQSLCKKNGMVVEIDYNELAEAIVRAQDKVDNDKLKKEKEEQERLQNLWQRALGYEEYKGTNKLYRKFDFLIKPLRIFIGVLFFKEEYLTEDNATYLLFKMCNDFMLALYRDLFSLLFGVCVLFIIKCFKSNYLFTVDILISIIVGISSLFISHIIKIAKLELAKSKNKDTITTMFNSIVSFTAMLFSVFAVIIALLLGK